MHHNLTWTTCERSISNKGFRYWWIWRFDRKNQPLCGYPNILKPASQLGCVHPKTNIIYHYHACAGLKCMTIELTYCWGLTLLTINPYRKPNKSFFFFLLFFFETHKTLDQLTSFPSSRKTISRPGFEPPTSPFGLGTSPLSTGSLASSWTTQWKLQEVAHKASHCGLMPLPSK